METSGVLDSKLPDAAAWYIPTEKKITGLLLSVERDCYQGKGYDPW